MKTHRTDGLSLTFGLIFVGIVVWYLVAQVVNISVPNVGWFIAATLIALGLLGLLGALRGGRDTSAPTVNQPARGGEADAGIADRGGEADAGTTDRE